MKEYTSCFGVAIFLLLRLDWNRGMLRFDKKCVEVRRVNARVMVYAPQCGFSRKEKDLFYDNFRVDMLKLTRNTCTFGRF